jgi:hypothetical protein
LSTEWNEEQAPEMQIKSMRAFQAFLRGVMPKKNVDTQSNRQKDTIAHLSISPNGHTLTIHLDMSCMARMRATVTDLRINGQNISITMKIVNLSSLELLFDFGKFILKKGQQTVGEVSGDLDIIPGEFEVNLQGKIQSGISGVVTIKGDYFHDHEDSWMQYAIRLFEAEVDLDKLDVGDADDRDDDADDCDDDDDDE